MVHFHVIYSLNTAMINKISVLLWLVGTLKTK